jgi:hypothetical protein
LKLVLFNIPVNELADAMLGNTILLLASYSAISLGVAVAAPLTEPNNLSAKQFIDDQRLNGRRALPGSKMDVVESVRITGGDSTEDTHWDRRTKRDDTECVRITGSGGYYLEEVPRTPRVRRDSVRIAGAEETGDTPWGRRIKRDEDGPDNGNEWGKVKARGDSDDGAEKEND